MDKLITDVSAGRTFDLINFYDDIQREILRKGIHLLIGLVPLLASINLNITIVLLSSGALLYTYSELLRRQGRPVFLISSITVAASRGKDADKIVLGPVTLALGALIALMLYPEPVAAIAIYSLAFGDSISSLVGKMIGYYKIPFTGGKTIAGSLACFIAIFIIVYTISGNVQISVIIGLSGTFLEMLPSGDLDNIILPVGTGFIASQLLF